MLTKFVETTGQLNIKLLYIQTFYGEQSPRVEQSAVEDM